MTKTRTWIAVWGVVGIAATFVDAIGRLGLRAHLELRGGITPIEAIVLIALTATFVYGEGVCVLQRRFAPVVVARSLEAARSGSTWWAIAAPLYAVSVVGAPARTIVRAVVGIALIVGCVIAVRQLPAPWRGIVDAAVASALTWGLAALAVAAYRALARPRPAAEPVPASVRPALPRSR